ncbi:MAG: replication-associated recombination protein A [Bacteroidales bacterium]|jgi:putative ATPase
MKNKPLAELMRPKSLSEFVGQKHLMGNNSPFRLMIEEGKLHSMIFWGPPGVGKTTLALLIASVSNREFFTLSAVSSGVKDVRNVIDKASEYEKSPILFIDEIHRFSKSQQDSLLNAVETGKIILIGATTENPSFEVITPLLSRTQVYVLKPLSKDELLEILNRTVKVLAENFDKKIVFKEIEALLRISGGDARKLINAIEIISDAVSNIDGEVVIDNEKTKKIIQQRIITYDKKGETHYDVISAFIKSIRGSDPNATVYWLARMIVGGEDPLFIARRMLILASEDIGNANPTALVIANNCFDAVNKVGYPECRLILSQTAIYLACSPKSNASYMAINEAMRMVVKQGDLPVPLHLRNAPTKLMSELGYGNDYKYAHDYNQNFVTQEFLPDQISNTVFYNPGKNKRENDFRNYLKTLWKDKYGY